MAVTTKSALADELGVTRARVSQYVKAGLPVRSDGKLNRDEALNWIKSHQLSIGCEDKGAVRARRLAQESAQQAVAAAKPAIAKHVRYDLDGFDPKWPAAVADNCRKTDFVGGIAVMAVMRMVYDAPSSVATMAVRTGSSMAQAYRLRDLMTIALMGHAEEALRDMNVQPFAGGTDLQWRLDRFRQNDWAALAKIAGEPHDEAAWHAAAIQANAGIGGADG